MDVLPATHLAIGSEDSPPRDLGLPVLIGNAVAKPWTGSHDETHRSGVSNNRFPRSGTDFCSLLIAQLCFERFSLPSIRL